MNCKLAIFDLDGTILDTLEDLTGAVNHVLAQFGYPFRTLDEVRQFVGNGIHRTLEQAVPPGTGADLVDQLYQAFTPYYQDHCADRTRPYEGIPELLRALRENGISTAVVSNKGDMAVKALCARYFPGLFDAAVGERPGVRRKPAPDGVLELLRSLNVPKEQAVYIGDSEVDVETARRAGLPCIGVDWGFRGRTFLLERGAPIVVDTPGEIVTVLSAL